MKFIRFNGELVNAGAVSEVVRVKVNDAYAIRLFRTDGSFMTSEVYDTEADAINRFEEIAKEISR